MTRLLALDLSSHTGFACGSVQEGIVESGTFHIPKTGENVGLFLAHYRKWLDSTITRYEPWTVFFEAPVLPGRGKAGLLILRKLYSLAGLTELVTHDRSLDCREANTSDIVTHFCGKGSPRFGDARKKATIAKCRERGWSPRDDNEADALALLDYAFSLIKPAHALEATPLFQGAA
jgi:crossover junction endodeoxyribonuclease RuvC